MRPTARAILSPPLGPVPRAIWSASLANAASVACSRSSRLRARSSANSGFLQTTSRSLGNSGAVISARSRSSNSDSWKAPVSSRARICGALSAVIQSSPAGFSSLRMRALVIMPRSPTSTTRDRPKSPLSLSICPANVIGSAVLPSKTSTATGQPLAAHNRPLDDLQFALLAVSRIAEACQLAALTLKPGRREVVEHQRPVREVAAGERSLDRALACAEPVEGAIELDLVDRAKPEEPAQARGGGVGGQLARGGELGGG